MKKSHGTTLLSMFCIAAAIASVSTTCASSPSPLNVLNSMQIYFDNIMARLAAIDGLNINTDLNTLPTITMAARLTGVDGGIISNSGTPAVYSSTLGLQTPLADQIKTNTDSLADINDRLDNVDGGSSNNASFTPDSLTQNESLWYLVNEIINVSLPAKATSGDLTALDSRVDNIVDESLPAINNDLTALTTRVNNIDGGASNTSGLASSPLTQGQSLWYLVTNIINNDLTAANSELDSLAERLNNLDGGSTNEGTLNGLTFTPSSSSNLWYSVSEILIRLNSIDGGAALNGDLNALTNSMYQQLKDLADNIGSGVLLPALTFNNFVAALPNFNFIKILPNQWLNAGNLGNSNKNGDERCMIYFRTDYEDTPTSKSFISINKGIVSANGGSFVYPLQAFTSSYDCSHPDMIDKKCLQVNIKSEINGVSNCVTADIANASNVQLQVSVLVVDNAPLP